MHVNTKNQSDLETATFLLSQDMGKGKYEETRSCLRQQNFVLPPYKKVSQFIDQEILPLQYIPVHDLKSPEYIREAFQD